MGLSLLEPANPRWPERAEQCGPNELPGEEGKGKEGRKEGRQAGNEVCGVEWGRYALVMDGEVSPRSGEIVSHHSPFLSICRSSIRSLVIVAKQPRQPAPAVLHAAVFKALQFPISPSQGGISPPSRSPLVALPAYGPTRKAA